MEQDREEMCPGQTEGDVVRLTELFAAPEQRSVGEVTQKSENTGM